jgi:hypothetical protein
MKARQVSIKHHRQKKSKFRSRQSCCGQLKLVLAAVETERDNLSQAESLLGCLKIAMEYGSETDKLPYYPDVAQIAGEMVRKSIQALDPINLPALQSKVREGFRVESVASFPMSEVPPFPLAILKTFPRKRSRLHRRNYLRRSMRAMPRAALPLDRTTRAESLGSARPVQSVWSGCD